MVELNWEDFVKDFVSEVDYDMGKSLDPITAEIPEEAQTDLDSLVRAVKKLAEKYLGMS